MRGNSELVILDLVRKGYSKRKKIKKMLKNVREEDVERLIDKLIDENLIMESNGKLQLSSSALDELPFESERKENLEIFIDKITGFSLIVAGCLVLFTVYNVSLSIFNDLSNISNNMQIKPEIESSSIEQIVTTSIYSAIGQLLSPIFIVFVKIAILLVVLRIGSILIGKGSAIFRRGNVVKIS